MTRIEDGKPDDVLPAVTVAVAVCLMMLAACSSGHERQQAQAQSARRTRRSQDGKSVGQPGQCGICGLAVCPRRAPGSACEVLTQQIAAEMLGQPTTVLDSESSSAGADCQRAGTRDVDDQIEYGWQKPGTPGYETPDQRASGCPGTISRPAEFGAGAVLCQYRPEPMEADWLGWTVNGVLYIVVIHVDDQELPDDAAVSTTRLLTS